MNIHFEKGQSIIEVVLAMAIFAFIGSAIAALSAGGFTALLLGGEETRASALVQEGFEAVRSIRDDAWNRLTYAESGIEISPLTSAWIFSGEGTFDSADGFDRVIAVNPVCRDIAGDIAPCPAFSTDPHTKAVNVAVQWQTRESVLNLIEGTAFLANWDSRDWVQTDWSGGAGQTEWLDATRYESDDGNMKPWNAGLVSLKSAGSDNCGIFITDFDDPFDYAYDSSKIEVLSSSASLIDAGTPEVMGSTVNTGFDADLSPWIFGTFGGVAPSGLWQNVGGNPGGYADISFPSARQTTSGGYFEQQFDVGVDSVDTAAVNLDWRISAFTHSSLKVTFYAFVDSASGPPVLSQAVWSSVAQGGVTPWNSSPTINVTQRITGPGTYYLKIAALTEYAGPTASAQVGFDNVRLSLVKAANPSYPADEPPVTPLASHRVSSIDRWNGFGEIAVKNGGEIWYQLSDNDGQLWKYWNGSSWENAVTATDRNTASVVNENIGSFPVLGGQILFRAFLDSDGSQKVSLDTIEIGCTLATSSPFDDPSLYAYDPSKIEVVGSSARLRFLTTPTQSGTTTNAGFISQLFPWIFLWWGGVQPSGSWVSSGGNPDGYAEISFPTARQTNSGGYFEQAFDITSQGVSTATLKFDWSIKEFSHSSLKATAYAFVDSASGPPVLSQAVWSSGVQGGVTPWNTVPSVDVSSRISGSGTYYFKVAVFTEYGGANARARVGFDNARIEWLKDESSGYSPDSPLITPLVSFASSDLDRWQSFSEIAAKGGGEIWYQLSDDGGSTWRYWNGGSWAIVAGFGDRNTAMDVDAYIGSFPATAGRIIFRAFLDSDGTQAIALDHVEVGYSELLLGGQRYAMNGVLVSSAFDTQDPSPIQVIEWDERVPQTCVPECSVRFEVRAAPDNGGSPGVWSEWFGEGGGGGVFLNADGSLIPEALNGNQWIQYRAVLGGDGFKTPVIEEVKVNYK